MDVTKNLNNKAFVQHVENSNAFIQDRNVQTCVRQAAETEYTVEHVTGQKLQELWRMGEAQSARSKC